MIIVLADDFSGAAEIAGIGHRYGLNTLLQINHNPESLAELIVIDTNTRAMTAGEAVNKTRMVAASLKLIVGTTAIFKKVDSVFRGHIIPEIEALRNEFNFNRMILLPANPARGRKIINGHYFINEISLDKTVFSRDPDFPIPSSSVIDLTGTSNVRHIHLKPGDTLPDATLITGDIASKNDIQDFIDQTATDDLCCGGADCFEAFLEHLGHRQQSVSPGETLSISNCLIMNGSTVKHPEEADLFKKLSIPVISLPGTWQGDSFVLPKAEQQEWHRQISASLDDNPIVAVNIDHPITQKKEVSAAFIQYFTELMRYLSGKMNMRQLHLCLTGGATASGVMTSMNINQLKVLKEETTGVVTIKDEEGRIGKVTVKPGSYQWPSSFIESLTNI